ncbi:MAG: hypothetical protein JNK33_01045 [Candidatus Doudnabacteria bacterium]|nr:hypothetical protein [Candidatus Doudnabacteria bacterium]
MVVNPTQIKSRHLGTYLRRLQLETAVGASASLSGGFLYPSENPTQ